MDGGVRQPAAAGDLAVGPAPLAQPLLDQPLERVERRLQHRGRGGSSAAGRGCSAAGFCSSPVACVVMAPNLAAFL